ncbi:hypothetical protein AAG570_012954 [Ranatra chinensis]|uniref:Uncharacterized protein n=1 Tax=Ranatra chinensis TaxID=642074 RepID=A0ABD0YFN4_9HEMI
MDVASPLLAGREQRVRTVEEAEGDEKSGVETLNCLLARQLCFEDPSCSPILETIPRVCGPESATRRLVFEASVSYDLKLLEGYDSKFLRDYASKLLGDYNSKNPEEYYVLKHRAVMT